MTLPASLPISLGQVYTEFGAPNGTALGAFVRGGAWVPNTPSNSGVPTSLPIRLDQLCGASNATLVATVTPGAVSGVRVTPGTATTSVDAVCTVTGSVGTISRQWLYVSGDSSIACSSSTFAATRFTATVNGINPLKTAVWRQRVIDSVLGTVYSNPIPVTLEYSP